jgi:membrane-bound serine protease (ClpP class)
MSADAASSPSGAAIAAAPLVGQIGTAATDLRPSGKVMLQGQRLEALSEHGYIEAGARVRVVRAEMGRLLVRAIEVTKDAEC